MTTNIECLSKKMTDAAESLAAAIRRTFPQLFPAQQPVDVMVDLETTGTGPNAAIVSIGAVAFDRETRTLNETFYREIDITTSVASGGVIEPSTFKWWLGQSDEARRSICGEEHINVALLDFTAWLGTVAPSTDLIRIWGNGPDFDMVILSEAYKRCHFPAPWKFWNVRCFRTLKNEYPQIRFERFGTHHNALDDAISQAEHILKIDLKRTQA